MLLFDELLKYNNYLNFLDKLAHNYFYAADQLFLLTGISFITLIPPLFNYLYWFNISQNNYAEKFGELNVTVNLSTLSFQLVHNRFFLLYLVMGVIFTLCETNGCEHTLHLFIFKYLLLYAIAIILVSVILLLSYGYMLAQNFCIHLTLLNLLVSIVLIICIYCFVSSPYYHFDLLPWLTLGSFHINWGFLFDEITFFMFLVVLIVSLLVHCYSVSYMRGDPHIIRFFAYLSLFTFFMLILISGNNFLQMFVGWEGVGLCSYLLISFWYTRIAANRAAIKALIMNRIGDVSLLFAMAIVSLKFHSLDYGILFLMVQYFSQDTIIFFNIEYPLITFVGIFFFIGAVGKSAQVGLHTWLPDAMEGPTPVSALIHAATMVTAGIYLMIRCSPFLEYSESLLFLLVIVGAITALMGSFLAIVQKDIKKIIAYSTCSQLGYMLVACGLSNYHYAFYHLITHASYKALLFLSAGSIIHSVNDEQDLRKLGGLFYVLPLTFVLMFIGSLSLMGAPWFSGYYSKDPIIELLYQKDFNFGEISWTSICLTCATFLTGTYSLFLIWAVFLRIDNFLEKNVSLQLQKTKYRDADFILLFPLILLAFLSIFLGYVLQPYFDISCGFFENILILNINSLLIEYLPFYIKLIPFIFFVFISLVFNFFSQVQFDLNFLTIKLRQNPVSHFKIKNSLFVLYNFFFLSFVSFYKFFFKGWFFDILYNKLIARPVFLISYFILKIIDKGYIEYMGPRGAVLLFSFLSNFILNLHKTIFIRYLEFGILVCFILLVIF